jgi:hypothetical protein
MTPWYRKRDDFYQNQNQFAYQNNPPSREYGYAQPQGGNIPPETEEKNHAYFDATRTGKISLESSEH